MAALIETDGHPSDEQPWLALVAALPVGLAVAALTDEGPGRILAVNPALRALLRGASGTPPDLLDEGTWVDLEERNRLRAALRDSSGIVDMPARLRRADGTIAYVEITAGTDGHAGGTAEAGATSGPGRRRPGPGPPAGARRRRAPPTRGAVAGPVPAVAAVREDGGAGPDDVRGGARTEQPARRHPRAGRAPPPAGQPARHSPLASRPCTRKPSAPRASRASCSHSPASVTPRA